jgi:hypothetical protein
MVQVKTVKIQAGARVLIDAMVLTISEHGGPVQTAGKIREESSPIKAGHWGTILHLETTCSRFNINKEENELISGTREKSAVADSAELKQ